MRPGLNRILVKPIDPPAVKVAGVDISDTIEKEKKAEGKVLAVGIGEHIKALGVKKGDVVVYGMWAGEYFKTTDDEELVILYVSDDSESDLLLIK